MSNADTRHEPQRDKPLTAEAEHLHWLAASRGRFRRTVKLMVTISASAIGLMAAGVCGYIAFFGRDADLCQDDLIPCVLAIGTLFGAVLSRSLG